MLTESRAHHRTRRLLPPVSQGRRVGRPTLRCVCPRDGTTLHVYEHSLNHFFYTRIISFSERSSCLELSRFQMPRTCNRRQMPTSMPEVLLHAVQVGPDAAAAVVPPAPAQPCAQTNQPLAHAPSAPSPDTPVHVSMLAARSPTWYQASTTHVTPCNAFYHMPARVARLVDLTYMLPWVLKYMSCRWGPMPPRSSCQMVSLSAYQFRNH